MEVHRIQRGCDRHGHTGDRLYDQQILGSVHALIAVSENPDIFLNLRILVLHDGVALLAAIRCDLGEPHLADVAGYRGLRRAKTGLSKFLDQLLLRLDFLLSNQLDNF